MKATLDTNTRQCSDIKARVLSLINQVPDPNGFKTECPNHGICIFLSDEGPCVKLVSRGGEQVEIFDEDPSGVGSFQVSSRNTPWKPVPGRNVTREELQAVVDRLPEIEQAFQQNLSKGQLRLESVIDLF